MSYIASSFERFWGSYWRRRAATGEVTTMFNSQVLTDIRQKKAMSQREFAGFLGISKPYLSYLERGLRKPGLELIEKLVNVTGVAAEIWLSDPSAQKDITTNAVLDAKNLLIQERSAHRKSQDRIAELEGIKTHKEAEICLRGNFEDILLSRKPPGEKRKKLNELAVSAMAEGELSFGEITAITRIERSDLRSLLDEDVNKRPYKCKLTGTEIMASSPGEAGLCFWCADCIKFDGGECLGHGNEDPHNIVEMLERLSFNGFYSASRQSDFLKKYRGFLLSAEEIRNVRYKAKNKLPIPDSVFYMDGAGRMI
jgi:transcriptional regulator with XRE-family HTH domain